MSYLNAALSQASGVSTAGKLSVAKSVDVEDATVDDVSSIWCSISSVDGKGKLPELGEVGNILRIWAVLVVLCGWLLKVGVCAEVKFCDVGGIILVLLVVASQRRLSFKVFVKESPNNPWCCDAEKDVGVDTCECCKCWLSNWLKLLRLFERRTIVRAPCPGFNITKERQNNRLIKVYLIL